jgi:hypothetical protein
MHESYEDITSKLGRPLWWDEVACPRYDPFHPSMCADIYAKEAVLLEIACQNCGHRFMVAMSRGPADAWMAPFSEQIRDGTLHYGDPPNLGCCMAGPTMNCEDLRVHQYWRYSRRKLEMIRVRALEVSITPQW